MGQADATDAAHLDAEPDAPRRGQFQGNVQPQLPQAGGLQILHIVSAQEATGHSRRPARAIRRHCYHERSQV